MRTTFCTLCFIEARRRHRREAIKVTACDPTLKAGKRADLAIFPANFIALAVAAMLGQPLQARAQTPGQSEVRELVIGT
jgi:hypothetical protein